MNTELIVPTKEAALEIFQKENGLDPFLKQIRAEIDCFVPDVSTKKGRDAIASIAYKVAKSKTALDDVGKELVSELKELPKKIDAERKRVREILDQWKDEVRKPLTMWEEKESSRIEAHRSNIANIKIALVDIDAINSNAISSRIETVKDIVVNGLNFEEFELEAARVRDDVLLQLTDQLKKRKQYELEQEELARLRAESLAREQKERDERIAREAEEKALKAAEEKARAEKEANEKRELELKLQAEKAEREKLEAQHKAEATKREALEREERLKAQAEQDKINAIEEEKARQAKAAREEEEARIAREKDKEHRAKINRQALQAFIDKGLSEECAKTAVSLIAKKLIPCVAISY